MGRIRAKNQAAMPSATQACGMPTTFGMPRRPCAPPVTDTLIATIRTTSPNPSVAMARNTPRSRSTGRPTISAVTAPTLIPTSATTISGSPRWMVSSAEV